MPVATGPVSLLTFGACQEVAEALVAVGASWSFQLIGILRGDQLAVGVEDKDPGVAGNFWVLAEEGSVCVLGAHIDLEQDEVVVTQLADGWMLGVEAVHYGTPGTPGSAYFHEDALVGFGGIGFGFFEVFGGVALVVVDAGVVVGAGAGGRRGTIVGGNEGLAVDYIGNGVSNLDGLAIDDVGLVLPQTDGVFDRVHNILHGSGHESGLEGIDFYAAVFWMRMLIVANPRGGSCPAVVGTWAPTS